MSSLSFPASPPYVPVPCSPDLLRAAALIRRLEDLRSITATTIQLIRCGSAAIPPLAAELRFGKPRSVSHPRCALVNILATLRANDVLLEYLADDRLIDDPMVGFAEDAVVNMAAQAIKLDFSAESYCVLFNLAKKKALPGVLEALSLYRRVESIPCFIRALEGDLSRAIATECLRSFGERAKNSLLAELLRPDPGLPEKESASSLRRRRACADVLATAQLSHSQCEALLDLLLADDVELVLNVSTILLISEDPRHHEKAVRRLKAMRFHADWLLQDELDAAIGRLEKR